MKPWHRYYDPTIGRYLNADPIGLWGGVNLFTYVGGDPVNWVDPWGLDTLGIHSNVDPGDGFTSGHAWITYTDDSGKTTYYGLWPDEHPRTVDNGSGTDVRTGLESGDTALHSRYYDLTSEQINRWKLFLKQSAEWRYTNTCASWASAGVRDTTGEDVDAGDWFWFETPREISASIIKLESINPTSINNPTVFNNEDSSFSNWMDPDDSWSIPEGNTE